MTKSIRALLQFFKHIQFLVLLETVTIHSPYYKTSSVVIAESICRRQFLFSIYFTLKAISGFGISSRCKIKNTGAIIPHFC